jgi:WbqC-like protein family
MQPYFFPYLGYFDLISYSDNWVVFDAAQYIRHGWVNRNRILHPKEGWQYVIVPLRKHGRNVLIKDVEINEERDWRGRIIGQLQHYKNKAPHFDRIIKLINECLSIGTPFLSPLNVAMLEKVCQYMGIPFKYSYFSEMNLELGTVKDPGDWALLIAKAIGAKEYVNPPGGRSIFDPSKFEKAGIKLTIRNLAPIEYECKGYEFVPGLSIIDVLMWNSPDKVRDYLIAAGSRHLSKKCKINEKNEKS